jgi:chromosome segregation ATPase
MTDQIEALRTVQETAATLNEQTDRIESLTAELEAANKRAAVAEAEVSRLRPLKAENVQLEQRLADSEKRAQTLQAEADQRDLRDTHETARTLNEQTDRIELLMAELETASDERDQDQAVLTQLLAERPQLNRQRADAEKRAETLQAEIDRRDKIDEGVKSPRYQAAVDRLITMVAERATLPLASKPGPAPAPIGHMTLEEQVAEVEAWMPTEAARIHSMPLLGGAKR